MAANIRTTRLANGLTVVSERMPDSRSVAVGFWVDAGSRDEEPPVAGASHFLEHLLFKGTDSRSARDIAEAVDAAGGEMNAFTTKEYTAFYVRALDEHLEAALDILSDIMWDPAFRADELEAERQVILEEILMHEDDPADLVHDVFTEALYPGHPLGREILGDRQTITTMSREQVRRYFSDFYRPSAIVVSVAGNVDHDQVAAGIERRCTAPAGERPPRDLPVLAPARPLAVTPRPTEQAHLVLGMRALPRADDDRFALAVLNQILGGGMASRLFQEIREKRGLAYAVYSYRVAYQESGALAVYAGTTPARAREVVQLVSAELDRFLDTPVTARELEVAKGHLKGSLALSLEDSGGRMSRIGRSQLVHGEVLEFDELVARSDSVTAADVARVAERVLGNPRVLAVIGPSEIDTFNEQVA